MILKKAEEIAGYWTRRLRPYCDRISVAGSIRRGVKEVKDIEIVCIPSTTLISQSDLFQNQEKKQVRVSGFIDVLKDEHEAVIKKGDPYTGKYIQLYIPAHQINIDIFTAVPENWGYILGIRTGSAEFSHKLASAWVANGYNGKDGFLHRDDVQVSVPDEVTLFKIAGMSYVQPWNRNL